MLSFGYFRKAYFIWIILIYKLNDAAYSVNLHIVMRCFVYEGFFGGIYYKAPEIIHKGIDKSDCGIVYTRRIAGRTVICFSHYCKYLIAKNISF